jgi:hypothetical protein
MVELPMPGEDSMKKDRMTMISRHLNGHHRKTLASIFRHPASHNVEWHDVLSLLNNLGDVTERHNGSYDVAIGTDQFVLASPHGHDLSGDELRHLKDFLTQAGLSPDTLPPEGPSPVVAEPIEHACIVLIDHHQARLFGLRSEGSDMTVPTILKSEDADGSARRVEHKQGNDDHDGGHAAEEDPWYERISTDLKAADTIVVLSDGKGRSSAGAYLVEYLGRRHPDIAKRIVATERVDVAHLSDGEIFAAGVALLEA